MDKEQATIETTKKPEEQENHETPRSDESPEELCQQMISESEKESDNFKSECADNLAQAETRAEKDGLTIDSNDKESLQLLPSEADGARAELLNEIEPPLPPDEEDGEPPLPQDEEIEETPLFPEKIGKKESAMKERIIEGPKLLSKKEASKKFFAEERKKLAEEIRAQRKSQREKLAALKSVIEDVNVSQESMEGEPGDQKYGQLLESQSTEANSIAERVSMSSELSEQDAQDERENISQLIANSENVKVLKEKIEEHYAKADAVEKERFDTLNRSLEHVMQRNNVFIVHKFEEKEGAGFRHDENYSNVSTETTYEDDLDIMLSFEPSISASSVIPGEKTKLWHGTSGFLLGGGQIGEAGNMDMRTIARSLKERRSEDGEVASIDKIDKVVSKKGNEYMNELVINNPEVFGFFQHAEIDKKGRIWAADKETRHYSEEVPGYGDSTDPLKLKSIVDGYRKRFAVAGERGMPLYIITATREVYEYLGINENGTVEIGKQLTPEEVANGRAGLPPEKRKQIGKHLLDKRIFRKQETQEEAKDIIDKI